MRRAFDLILLAVVRIENTKSTICSDVAVLENWSPHLVRLLDSDRTDFEKSLTEVKSFNIKILNDTKRGEFVKCS